MDELRTYDMEEASRILKVTKRTMRGMINRFHIPVARIGRKLLIPQATLHQFIEWRLKIEQRGRGLDQSSD